MVNIFGNLSELLIGQHSDSQTFLALKSFCAKEISWDDLESLTALDLSKRSDGYLPRAYPDQNETLRKYVQERLNGLQERDSFLAAKNGDWLQTVVLFREKNKADYELLAWAEEICRRVGAASSSEKLQEAAQRFVRNHDFFISYANYSSSLRVQEKDSSDRRRGM